MHTASNTYIYIYIYILRNIYSTAFYLILHTRNPFLGSFTTSNLLTLYPQAPWLRNPSAFDSDTTVVRAGVILYTGAIYVDCTLTAVSYTHLTLPTMAVV